MKEFHFFCGIFISIFRGYSLANERAKEAAGHAAAELIQDGMLVGLGTGSTAEHFIDRLAQRCREGLRIQAVATSKKSSDRASVAGIPIVDVQSVIQIDITVDGADEIDEKKRMIKGGGGALVREKIIASMSREMVVVVDSTKLVKQLGKFPLPVEIVPFAYKSTIHKLEELGYKGTLRQSSESKFYITDNQNYIFDIHFPKLLLNPEKDAERIRYVPGVVDTGFFFNLAGRVVVGYEDGRVEIRS